MQYFFLTCDNELTKSKKKTNHHNDHMIARITCILLMLAYGSLISLIEWLVNWCCKLDIAQCCLVMEMDNYLIIEDNNK